MGEVVNVVVALAVIVFLFRWATSSSDTPADRSTAATLGFRPKNVTSEMIETIESMFPDIPRDNIRYDLLRTGNVEVTSHKILERGYLDAPPPAYYRAFSRPDQQAGPAGPRAAASSAAASSSKSNQPSLISRFHLEQRLADDTISAELEQAGGKAAWEATSEKREASLRERKAQMVLAARKRMLSQQSAAAAVSSSASA